MTLTFHCVKNVCILRIFLYSVRMRENADQKNSEYGHFLRNVCVNTSFNIFYLVKIHQWKLNQIPIKIPTYNHFYSIPIIFALVESYIILNTHALTKMMNNTVLWPMKNRVKHI